MREIFMNICILLNDITILIYVTILLLIHKISRELPIKKLETIINYQLEVIDK